MNDRRGKVGRLGSGLLILILLVSLTPSLGMPVFAVSPNIVISQVYGGGGNSGATYTHDFVELFNRGTTAVSLEGWSIQYTSATGTSNFGANSGQITELGAFSLAPGQYLLIQEAQGSGGTTPLPTPDVTDASPIAMSATGGKVALVNTTTPLGCNGGSTPCSPAQLEPVVDLVGYGSADFSEGAAAPGPSNTTAVLRASDGCQDTDNNAADFAVGAPNPRNTSSALHPCGAPADTDGDGILDDVDNCPYTPNPGQEDGDGDGVGDACDACPADPENDADGDGVCGDVDNCPYAYNPGQEDSDGDGVGDACEIVPTPVIINEVDSDTPGTDVLEFIELYDGGTGNTSLDGLAVVLYNGNGDVSYAAFDLDGYATDGDGYFLLGNTAVAPDITFASNGLQNGADAVALYSGDATGFPNGTAVTTSNLVDAIVYDTSDPDDAGLLVLLNAEQPQVNEGANDNSATESNQRCPNGEGGARNTDAYTQFTPTPRATNCELPPEACGDPFTPIYDVQGSGAASALVGTEVAVEGIVVGDFQNNCEPDNGDLNGFHIQDPTGDGDAATSDGVFVYAPGGMDVSLGDAVRVRGTVSEYYGLTEISASQIWLCPPSNSVSPTPLALPVVSLDDFEPYEGMLVTFPDALYISEYFNFDRYGEIVLTSQRQYQPTAVYDPTDQAALVAAEAQANLLGRITLDDGRTSQNPDPAIHPNGLEFTLDNLFRGGDTVTDVTGVLDYSYDLYRIQPTQGANYTSANPRTAAPDPVGGNLKVASFNVLNYFTTFGSRGADNQEEFDRQRDKIFAALEAIDADVVGLIEIENNGEALVDLVTGLNEWIGTETYAAIVTGPLGVDEITVALIYKPATVAALGDFAVLDDPSFTDPRNYDDQQSRPALAQTFMDKSTCGVFTVVVNHLKSKNCYDYATDGDVDLGDGQGCFNETRRLGAQALIDWLATRPTGSGDVDFLIIGDLNAYDKEDPIDVLLAGGYTDLIYDSLGEYAYSYVFDGQLGYLDHALANASLLDKVTGTTVWHINADEPDLIDYDMTYKQDAQDALYAPDAYRSSDHDPVVVGVTDDDSDVLAPTLLEVSVSPDTLWPANHKYVEVTATFVATDNFDPNPTVSLVSVESNEPDDGLGDGDTPNDIVIVDDLHVQLRAERSGLGTGRVYTLTYVATDACGNQSMPVSVTVTVPFDQRNKKG
jgi:predicted extracellular nuclease